MSDARDRILKVLDRKIEKVTVPEWGDEAICLKTLSVRERDDYTMRCMERTKGETTDVRGMREALLVMCIVDEDGAHLFSRDDEELLGGKSAEVIDRLYEIACKLNGLGEDEVKEAEKN
jgi:hypothetical protein